MDRDEEKNGCKRRMEQMKRKWVHEKDGKR